MRQVVLLSGHSCNGKSKLAKMLACRCGFHVFKTSDHLRTPKALNRDGLKKNGDLADIVSGHRWVLDEVKKLHGRLKRETPIVVDCLRNFKQIRHFRKQYEFEVTHVHLYARQGALESRFRKKLTNKTAELSHAEMSLLGEADDIENIKNDADIRIFTERSDVGDVYTRVLAYLGHFASPDYRGVDVIVGGQYGSEGKGQVAAYLAQEYDVLMRVGGPNAGHSAARASGKYTYHSLPSGCRDTTADVIIGAGATIFIPELLKEIQDCGLDASRLFIDPSAMVITPDDRAQEAKLVDSIGSTGRGGGAAAARRIMGRLNCVDGAMLAAKYDQLHPFIKSAHERLQLAFLKRERVLLEGTQGSELSLFHGEYPFVTSRDTNISGCLAEAGIPPARVRKSLLVVRYTPIRVESPKGGTSGTLKNETTFETVANMALIPEDLNEKEKTSTTHRQRRVAWFDWEQFRKACELNGPTDIILTFADYQHVKNREAHRFEQLTEDTIKFIEELQRVAQAPVSLINTRYPHDEVGPMDLRTLIDRRHWRIKLSN
ncbi:adenylosuccinate synthetase [Kordiimonas sp.]|uniref:adenylosuccinate synthetase n=1 Tax=Kordiimonas sp. TaxID=1970157 RepID=UPI003A94D142